MTDDAEFRGDPRAPDARHRGRKKRAHRPVTLIGVLGELLITAGAVVLLFLGWQLWWNDMMMANSQTQASSDISQQWIEKAVKTPAPPASESPEAAPASVDYGEPIIAPVPEETEPFAVLYIPRFGADYHRTIAEGIKTNVLNSPRTGIGHYPGTQMPGEVGNFAIASHRSANGGGMHLINEFQLGDAIYVQTADGYFTYRFRDLQYVPPTAATVIASVPGHPEMAPVDRIITLTSCNPLLSTAERIIAYGVFESWQPLSAGAPSELAPIIAAQAQG